MRVNKPIFNDTFIANLNYSNWFHENNINCYSVVFKLTISCSWNYETVWWWSQPIYLINLWSQKQLALRLWCHDPWHRLVVMSQTDIRAPSSSRPIFLFFIYLSIYLIIYLFIYLFIYYNLKYVISFFIFLLLYLFITYNL